MTCPNFLFPIPSSHPQNLCASDPILQNPSPPTGPTRHAYRSHACLRRCLLHRPPASAGARAGGGARRRRRKAQEGPAGAAAGALRGEDLPADPRARAPVRGGRGCWITPSPPSPPSSPAPAKVHLQVSTPIPFPVPLPKPRPKFRFLG